MASSLKIGSIYGIEIRIHISLILILLLLSYVFYISPFPYGFMGIEFAALLSIISSISLFIAVLLHELAHSILSLKSGINVRGIILFIFGGVSLIEDIPKEPEKEMKIAFAGPLTSLILGFGAILISQTLPAPLYEFFYVFGRINIFLAVFNLIPAFPLDGGRILRAFMSRSMGFVRATRVAAETGKFIAILFGIVGLLYNPWLILIALFIYMGANEEEKLAVVENILRKIKISEIMTPKPIFVTPETTLEEVKDLMFRFRHLGYPVVENGEVVGIVTLHDVVRGGEKVADVMSREIVSISPDDDAYKAFRLMNQHNIGRIPVVKEGQLVGIVSRTDLIRVLEILEVLSGE